MGSADLHTPGVQSGVDWVCAVGGPLRLRPLWAGSASHSPGTPAPRVSCQLGVKLYVSLNRGLRAAFSSSWFRELFVGCEGSTDVAGEAEQRQALYLQHLNPNETHLAFHTK